MEQKVLVKNLQVGYKLAHPVRGKNGKLVANKDAVLTDRLIEFLKLHNVRDVLIVAKDKLATKIETERNKKIEELFKNFEDNSIMQAIKKASIEFFKEFEINP